MIITNTNFTVNFSPINEIKKVFINNANLSEYFNEPTILPIPDNAPDEVPRIICQSINNHSNLSITKTALSLNTMYDEEFQNKWPSCRSYLSEKIEVVLDLLNCMDCNFKFSGLVTQVMYDPTTNDSTQELFNKFSKVKTSENVYDYNQKLTMVKDDRYFINLSISNIRLFNGGDQLTPGFLEKETGNKICIIIDVNDRYEFNYNPQFISNSNNINNLLELTDNCISNLNSFVERAEVII